MQISSSTGRGYILAAAKSWPASTRADVGKTSAVIAPQTPTVGYTEEDIPVVFAGSVQPAPLVVAAAAPAPAPAPPPSAAQP